MSEPPKLDLIQGKKTKNRRVDMLEVLEVARQAVAKENIERLMIILEREGEPPYMMSANYDCVYALGMLQFIIGLVQEDQTREWESPEDEGDDDAPPED